MLTKYRHTLGRGSGARGRVENKDSHDGPMVLGCDVVTGTGARARARPGAQLGLGSKQVACCAGQDRTGRERKTKGRETTVGAECGVGDQSSSSAGKTPPGTPTLQHGQPHGQVH
jgi:hypothetical protein